MIAFNTLSPNVLRLSVPDEDTDGVDPDDVAGPDDDPDDEVELDEDPDDVVEPDE